MACTHIFLSQDNPLIVGIFRCVRDDSNTAILIVFTNIVYPLFGRDDPLVVFLVVVSHAGEGLVANSGLP